VSFSPVQALSGLPESLRTELLDSFSEIVRNFRENRWEPSELNGGKLCEIIYTILRGHVDGAFPAKSAKPKNMLEACKEFEKADSRIFPRSVRIQIPRMLISLYEVRNNRGVGHVGGDVNPNHMDSVVVLEISKWCIAELIRVFQGVSTTEATRVVDALVDRTLPIVWEVSGRKRILDPSLTSKDQMLLLLYSESGEISEKDLVGWIEHSNPSVFRRDILRKCHAQRLIDYDLNSGMVQISPTGIKYVEQHLPLKL
jgi:hypothetical protein